MKQMGAADSMCVNMCGMDVTENLEHQMGHI